MPTSATNPPGLTPTVKSSPAKRKTPAQLLRIAERRRERKAEARTEREAAANGLAQQLEFLADREEFAPWRADLNALVNTVRLSGKRTPDRDVETVKRALSKPLCYSLDDISLESDIPARELLPILTAMQAAGVVEQRPVPRTIATSGRNEAGWFLTGAPARSPMVLP